MRKDGKSDILPPNPGEPFTMDQFQEIMELVKKRQEKFSSWEPPIVSMAFILLNIGEVYSRVKCIDENCKWGGLKQDVKIVDDNIPCCPSGHAVIIDKHIKLGWVEVDQ